MGRDFSLVHNSESDFKILAAWQNPASLTVERKLSLYIHIPFCASFCDYCDFYSVKKEEVSKGYIRKFLNSLIEDIKKQIECFNIVDIPTAYIGGGTPSVLGKDINILLDGLNKIKEFKPVEFTIEANPESLSEEFLSACREGGVNRLSLGVQTFNDKSRSAVNRIGNASLVEERLALASRYFAGSLSADLITGLPFQDEKTVIDDIKRLMAYDPAHVSLYSLTVEDGTALQEKIRRKEVILPDSDTADLLWLKARDTLKNEGFNHYEVSNFAQNGKECIHNIRYWLMEGWFGTGPAASGTIINEETASAKRYTYPNNVEAYIKKPAITSAVCEELDRRSLMREFLLMGYRYHKGPGEQRFAKIFGRRVEDVIPQTLERWKDRDKMTFLNKFLEDAFDEEGKEKGSTDLH
jgi:oxygen-independent coproporphyrinogen-3 oxidase